MSGVRTIYLIRHGQTEGGDGAYLGRTDLPLSPEGVTQARELARHLPPVAAVYCSPLRRCVDTAAQLTAQPIPVPGLMELDMGDWELVPRGELKTRCPALYAARGLDFAHFTPPGGESLTQCARRAWAALEGIARTAHGDVAVVAHAGVNRALLCTVTGRPLQDWLTFPQPHCGVTALRLEGTQITLLEIERSAPDHE